MQEASTPWTTHLTEVLREGDGERIGYLRSAPDNRWLPLNLLGMPLGDALDRDTAEQMVRQNGMPSLMGELWCKLPRPLTEPVTDARQVRHNSWWERVAVIEINQNEATIRPYYPMEEEQSHVVSIQLPAHDVLKVKEPQDSDL